MEGPSTDDRRSLQARAHRPDRQDHHARSQREMVGQPAKLDASSFARSTPTRRSTRWPTARSTPWTSGPDANKYQSRQEHLRVPRSASPAVRTSATSRSTAPARSCRTSGCGRRWPWRSTATAIARALLGPLGIDARPLGNTSSWRTRTATRTTPATSASTTPLARATARRGRLEARRQGAKEGRPAAGDQLRDPCWRSRRRGRRSELMQNMLAQIGVTLRIDTVPTAGLLRQVHHARAVRLHGLLMDGHAVSDQLVEVGLREAHPEH